MALLPLADGFSPTPFPARFLISPLTPLAPTRYNTPMKSPLPLLAALVLCACGATADIYPMPSEPIEAALAAKGSHFMTLGCSVGSGYTFTLNTNASTGHVWQLDEPRDGMKVTITPRSTSQGREETRWRARQSAGHHHRAQTGGNQFHAFLCPPLGQGKESRAHSLHYLVR